MLACCFFLFAVRGFSEESQLIRIDFPTGTRDQSGIIHSICQDYLGYIWIGQSNGLYRFDGYEYKKVPSISESAFGISNNSISCLFEDSDSLFWIGTKGGGLNLYDRKHDRFSFFTSDSQNPRQKIYNDIISIYEDPYKNLWVGTDGGGLYRLNKTDLSLVQVTDSENQAETSREKVLSIYRGSKDEMYIGTWENGLKKINLQSGKWTTMFPDLKRFPLNSRRNVWSITDLGNQKLLLGTFGEGALLFDIRTKQIQNIKEVNARNVFCGQSDKEGTLFLGTEAGLEIIKNGERKHEGSPTEIRAIHFDRNGHLWVGQQQNLWALKKIQPFFVVSKAGSGRDCSTLFIDHQATMWAAFPGKMVQLNENGQLMNSYRLPEKVRVNMISKWNDQILVLATSEGFLFFDKKKGQLSELTNETDQFREFVRGNALFIIELADSSKWMSTLGVLLGKTEGKDKYISEESLPGFSMSHYVFSAIQNSDGSFWLGTFGGGLNHIGSNLKFLKNFKQNFSSRESLSNNFVECLIFDNAHRLWAGTHDGLNLMTDSAAGTFKTYTVKDGLPNNEINPTCSLSAKIAEKSLKNAVISG